MDNIELIPLELITSNRDGIRKAREAFLIPAKGKTLEPFGLNRRYEIWSIYFLFFNIYPFWYKFKLFSNFVNLSCHIYFLLIVSFKFCNRFTHIYLASV